ncbi:MAG: GTPase HflX, partial [Pseudomonadales bacterium]|nr:GTPase HflX [Pseudomonadales bacterium]
MFIERPKVGLRALLVFSSKVDSSLATLVELEELVGSAGLDTVATVTNPRKIPHPKSFVGSGKLQEICDQASQFDAGIIVFSEDLSPSQEKNIEQAAQRRVLGRTGLILEIFAQRARTHEGKLQVELAQLQHAASRLVRGWTHLDRQRGGSGKGQGVGTGLSGDGETQLEADQRQLRARTKKVNQKLAKVQRQRKQNRKARQRSETATVALAGYTNSGKSTLFNALSHADVPAADQL